MRHHVFAFIVPLLLIAPAPSLPQAIAQADETVADLRRENDQLRERIAQLEATLATLIEQNQNLIDETKALREAVQDLSQQVDETRDAVDANTPGNSNTAPGDPIEEPALADDPGNPMASPGLLLAALKRDHTDRFVDVELETPEQQKRYQNELRRWFRSTERDFSARIEWLLHPVNTERLDRENVRLIFLVIDPKTELPYDPQPAAMIVNGRDAARLMEHADTERWRLNGVFSAKPQLNTERTEQGLVDTPPFIGPYVEYAFELRATSLVPIITR